MRQAAMAAMVGLALLIPSGMVGCSRQPDPWQGEGSPRIVVTIAPLYSFVKAVAGDRVAVRCLCTANGPHHFQADTHDARLFGGASAVFAVGLKLDESFTDALVTLSRRKDLPYIKLGERLPRQSLLEPLPGAHSHGKYDPHVWLGIAEAVEMVGVIRDELAKLDPEHAKEYRDRAEEYIAKLKRLDADGKAMLKDRKVKRIITFHAALAYFARSFDLDIAAVIEEGPGDEPTSGHLARIVELCGNPDRPIGAITVEPQYPRSTSAATVQKELQARKVSMPLVEVDPLETADARALKEEGAGWYEARMRQNLKALADALK